MLCSGRTFREIDGSVEEGEDRGGRRCCAVGGRSWRLMEVSRREKMLCSGGCSGRLMEVSRREKMLCSGRTFREIDGSVEEGEDAV